ncbi:3'-5' exoribonuclease domain-containing protein [Nostoc sp.]|uniref:3'-5' exoribonuclease domain-containing protein n=1 Tax=Nostoc sp. TaxID=1180 RepID=UPI002FF28C92
MLETKKTKYFIDTEFIDDGRTIDLISIGIVCQDGHEYYAISTEFDPNRASQWVRDNVLAKLPPRHVNPVYESPRIREESRAWKSRSQIRQEILKFITEPPELWGYYSAYDFVAFSQLMSSTESKNNQNSFLNLFGLLRSKKHNPMVENYPSGYPYYCNDIKQWCKQLGNPRLPEEGLGEHHALIDAKWVKAAWEFLRTFEEDCVVERG